MLFNKVIVGAGVMLAAAIAMAEPAPKFVDLGKLHGSFERAGNSSLDLIEANEGVLISGVVLKVNESIDGDAILSVGARANSPELARLAAADDAQDEKLKAFKPGAKFKAVCDLAFTSGTQYMSFQDCVFK